ncbi:MAG TPA: hypothetical protein PK184_03025 [Phycisphaerae bacterium]|nr:hypothetical protein [Phycisphaerae bacterium]HOL27297.1 hypothetical protein [Phycisphaerae bacterium]HPP22825.1 hypothetical protein [Phycisphaerae bacterium]HPU31648.1 hypothetical protein [Phycisphaerae bacterium]HQE42642.1 hypothetical protein [Phycisphaerae bacterium]
MKHNDLHARFAFLAVLTFAAAAYAASPLTFECDSFSYSIDPQNGRNAAFIDKNTGTDCLVDGSSPCARIRKAGKDYPATAASRQGDLVRVQFGDSGITAELRYTPRGTHLLVEVVAVTGEGLDELTFTDIPLKLKGEPGELFAACCLALNLKTNVHELPGPNSRLRAMCYPRFGTAGAAAALVGCPTAGLRKALQDAVAAAPELPHSPLGGPWALDAEINRGSYLFNFTDLTEQTVDDWIRAARACGMNQIDFHGGHSFRFGDLVFNPQLYPRGRDSMRAVIDKLHAAGIKAGLHTYCFFIDKKSPYVTPVPDKRLGKDATFTLTEDLPADATTVYVAESTENMSAVTGFFVRNSATLQIGDELIVYSGVKKDPPFAFTGCQRGAHGTKVSAHPKGTKVYHLRECFGLFLPDGDSTLFEEIAARHAEVFNDCGFDMMYLDALDGEGAVASPEVGWYYGTKFVFDIWKHLKRPALMEMSTFRHHLWYVRSRYIAWDHPNRGHKRFIDLHCKANEQSRRMFLPGHLGWWLLIPWKNDPLIEPTYADDVEYLCCKGLGTDTGFSLIGLTPETLKSTPAFERLAAITRQYEELRHAGQISPAVKAALAQPGQEYTLVRKNAERFTFRPVSYDKHKADRLDGTANVWTIKNGFDRQPLKLRIEALFAVGPYDAPDNTILADFTRPDEFAARKNAPGMTAELTASNEQVKVGTVSGRYTATNDSAPAGGPTWTSLTKTFSPPLNIKERQGLGFWLYGDGNGEVLNLQLRSPEHLPGGYIDHYVTVDFTGWRYIELVEAEGDRCADYQWPYSNAFYDVYREPLFYDQVLSLGLWFNDVPAGKTATCYLSPVKALPLVKARLVNPTITVGGKRIVFPVTMETGSYLELGLGTMSSGAAPSAASTPAIDCKLYGPNGELLSDVKLDGELPMLEPGTNRIEFRCETDIPGNPRARVTIVTHGEPLD